MQTREISLTLTRVHIAPSISQEVGFEGLTINQDALSQFIGNEWDTKGIPSLSDFVRIPCISPKYDPEWHTNGKLVEALNLFKVRGLS